MVQATSLEGFDLAAEIERIQQEDVLASLATFLEVNTPFPIRVTTAQQICNMNDHKDVALVFDMRSQAAFNECSLDKSVNFAVEQFTEDTFINWTAKSKQLETDSTIFKNKYQLHGFKRRRRHWVFIIGAHDSHNLNKMVRDIGKISNQAQQTELIARLQTDQERMDYLSLRNACLLFKALKKERLRELDLSICGFDKIAKHYQHHCLNSERQHLIPLPQNADQYPNEIFPGRLYLGDWHHASDSHIVETLGITHIVNISDTCENYLAESHPYLNYLHLCLHDEKEQRLLHVFQEIFEFIKEATLPDNHDCSLHDLKPADTSSSGTGEQVQSTQGDQLVQEKELELPVSNQVLEVNFKTNSTEVKTGLQQKEYVRIQKLFRQVNRDNPEFKGKCLVHCAMGMSRSATSVIMFIMRLFSMKLEDAFEFVKTQREATDPNDGFLEQLRNFEETQFAFEGEQEAQETSSTLSGLPRQKSCVAAVPLKEKYSELHKLEKSHALYGGLLSAPSPVKKVTSHASLLSSQTEEIKSQRSSVAPESIKPSDNIEGPPEETKKPEPFSPPKVEAKPSPKAIKPEPIESSQQTQVKEPPKLKEQKPAPQIKNRDSLTTSNQTRPTWDFSHRQMQSEGKKVFNFSTGPGKMPPEVLRMAQSQMLNWQGTGISVMEMSHRSKEFVQISEQAKASLRRMLDIPDNFHILFTQGGAQMQFSAICYNLLAQHNSANYLISGDWSKHASKEAAKFCKLNIVDDTSAVGFNTTRVASWNVSQNADFFHFVDNETANGFEHISFPFDKVPASQPLVCDMSSSFLTKPIDWSKYGVVYASAQKQAGIANLCITVVRGDLIGRHQQKTPSLLAWETYRQAPDTYPNTPNTWGVYMCGLTVDYQLSLGGLGEMQARARARSTPLYKCIDESAGYYRNAVQPGYRSRVNVTFHIGDKNKALEEKFVQEAEAKGLIGLAGHAWVGGIRVTMNNAQGFEGVFKLMEFMREFKVRNPL